MKSDYLSYMNEDNIAYIESLYESYQEDPTSVEDSWRYFFEGYDFTKKNKILGLTKDQKDNAKVEALINRYRQIGHLYANLNPLEQSNKSLFEEEKSKLDNVTLEDIFNPSDLTDQAISLGDIVEKLEQTYCHHIGADISSLSNPEQSKWFLERMESCNNTPQISSDEKKHIHLRLSQAEGFEKFLQRRYLGQKRFSVEGLDSLVPLFDTIVNECAEAGAKEINIGMAHRGRLNVLRNILQRPALDILKAFEDSDFNPYDIDGDVKYHMGHSNTVKSRSGKEINIFMSPNPSHLEAVNPVLEGYTRCRQENLSGIKSAVPILVHGDAAFCGQGIVSETLNLSKLNAYSTGGTIHIITNNNIGFTTNPHESRSCYYSSDISKVIRAPVIHVNSDDPEAAVWAAHLACSYRNTFHEDVVIDLIGYRRHGHNETDEPSFTQPQLYKIIKEHPTVLTQYSEKLVQEGVLKEEDVKSVAELINDELQAAYDDLRKNPISKPKHKPLKELNPVVSYRKITHKEFNTPVKTALTKSKVIELAKKMTTLPKDFVPHPKIKRLIEMRAQMTDGSGSIDWGFAELLSFASLSDEGFSIRLSGQDSQRGTFSSRHGVLKDYETSKSYEPLKQFKGEFAEIINSPLSELGCLGFEFGYSVASRKSLILWEAQFGDFVNGAQIVIDQFLVASEAKWQMLSGLVLLLPHGHEGMGPEHTSARPERFLQCCGNLNIQVCYPTTPAQYFHLLRRQMHSNFRKPLIIMSPKSMLRHPLVRSATAELCKGSFEPLLAPKGNKVTTLSKLVFCSGKIYYELEEALGKSKKKNKPLIVRFEQLYPFPKEQLTKLLKKYPKTKAITWVQEEPENMGAWTFIRSRINEVAPKIQLNFVGRKNSGSTAEGSLKAHSIEQARIIKEALS